MWKLQTATPCKMGVCQLSMGLWVVSPPPSFIEKVGDVYDNEVVDSLQAGEYYNENSFETSEQKKGDDIKFETVESKHSTSQEVYEARRNPLIESIGELLEAETGLMLSQIKLDIATNVKDLKLDNASMKNELKSDNASLKVEIAHNAKKLESDIW